jgi:hypothetical protein
MAAHPLTIAAAEIDQVIHRYIDRDFADHYYGLLCDGFSAWSRQKRSLGCSITPIRSPGAAEITGVIIATMMPSLDGFGSVELSITYIIIYINDPQSLGRYVVD